MLRWRSRDSSVLKRRLESNYGIQRKRSYRNSSWQEKKKNKKQETFNSKDHELTVNRPLLRTEQS